jgi:hypothetical protein
LPSVLYTEHLAERLRLGFPDQYETGSRIGLLSLLSGDAAFFAVRNQSPPAWISHAGHPGSLERKLVCALGQQIDLAVAVPEMRMQRARPGPAHPRAVRWGPHGCGTKGQKPSVSAPKVLEI